MPRWLSVGGGRGRVRSECRAFNPQALSAQLSPQLRRAFAVPSAPLLVLLLCSVLVSVVFAALVLLREAARDLRQPKLRYKGSGALVSLTLEGAQTHHLFVSHVYACAATPPWACAR